MNFTIGQRISARGEDFIVIDVKTNHDASFLLQAEGISELVKGKRFAFDTKLDTDIKPLDPQLTMLVPDNSTGYRKTKLFLETQIRNAALFSEKITIGHKAAIDVADYQLTPTLKAMQLPRPRMLIADAVGLGKTIEVGIFLSEMIKRGRGKRIMILAPKSILTQFQHELWNRFSIPFVRLDSEGIARIKTILPANKNPFEYYDKTIISIDTLKNNAKFRHYLEKSRWDIICIDECHVISNDKSQRGSLAQFLAKKCESLILTSATPHNGTKESFANLISMIEPTAIPKSREYSKEHVEPYYVRRFKKDIRQANIRDNFKDREIIRLSAQLSETEIDFLSFLQGLKLKAVKAIKNGKPKDDFLFSIGIFKAFMSSPKAALVSLERRIEKVAKIQKDSDFLEDNLEMLQLLKQKVENVLELNRDSKYLKLEDFLVEDGFSNHAKDRYVIFAERIDTLHYLEENLKKEFDLKEESIALFHGGLSDVEQSEIVDDFGRADSKIRILICSDAGSQGVNLHFYCHKMINYDIPWSLITLEQRNGRIDRYGQTNTPYIYYIIAETEEEGVKTDLHIVEKLIQKEEIVYKTLGDAGSVMKLYDVSKEEDQVAEAILDAKEDFLENSFDFASLFDQEAETTEVLITEDPYEKALSIYSSDESYYAELFEQLRSANQIRNDEVDYKDGSYFEIKCTPELNSILFDLPAKPKEGELFRLTNDKKLVQKAIADARKKKGDWAEFQMLYDLHPLIRYYMTKLEASVQKDAALVAKTTQLPADTAWFLIHAQVSNNLGQPVIADFKVVGLKWDGSVYRKEVTALDDFIREFALHSKLYTMQIHQEEIDNLQEILPDAIVRAELYMIDIQQKLQNSMEEKLKAYETQLKHWHSEALQQLELDFEERNTGNFWGRIKDAKQREIDTILNESGQYFKDMSSLQGDPYLKILAVFFNK
jgi:SNF2 family DNA or RNA helicase